MPPADAHALAGARLSKPNSHARHVPFVPRIALARGAEYSGKPGCRRLPTAPPGEPSGAYFQKPSGEGRSVRLFGSVRLACRDLSCRLQARS